MQINPHRIPLHIQQNAKIKMTDNMNVSKDAQLEHSDTASRRVKGSEVYIQLKLTFNIYTPPYTHNPTFLSLLTTSREIKHMSTKRYIQKKVLNFTHNKQKLKITKISNRRIKHKL